MITQRKIENEYLELLNRFFHKTLYFQHISHRIDKVFQKDVEKYTTPGAWIRLNSAHVISDWTEPDDNGWEINFLTGIFKETKTENYKTEIEKLYARQLALLYAQSYEALERFLKDCLWIALTHNIKFKTWTEAHKNKMFYGGHFKRNKMRGGDSLFRAFTKAGNSLYEKFTQSNNQNIRFKELWFILSQTRHAIIHNESIVNLEKIEKTSYHRTLFNYLFKYKNLTDESVEIKLNYKQFRKVLKTLSEFAYQIYKILSIEEGLEWKIK